MRNVSGYSAWITGLRLGLAALAIGWIAGQARSAEEKPIEEGFVSLFDGKSLAGWTGAKKSYKVEDGAIVCVPGSSGNLLTEKEYTNFVVQFEFLLTPGANNGLGVHCPLRARGNLHIDGTEIQILDDTAEKFKDIKSYQHHGSVYGITPAKPGHLKPVGQWNHQTVICSGRNIKVVLNGETIVDTNLDQATAKGTLDGHKHPGLKLTRGHLGFLGHGDQIEVRNLFIKELP